MKREGLQLVIFIAAALTAIVVFAIIFRVIGLADEKPEITLPAPEWQVADVITLGDEQAPEVGRPGLNVYPTFEEVLCEKMTAVDSSVADVAGRLIWGEGGAIGDAANRQAALWTAINRVDAWGGTLLERMTEENAFHGLGVVGDVPEQFVQEARLIIALWEMEREGWIIPTGDFPAGLPERFLFFEGDGTINHFSTSFGGGEYWNGVESRWDT